MPGIHKKRSAPDYVQSKVGEKDQRQWVHIFNSVIDSGGSMGSAYAQANGTVLSGKTTHWRSPVRQVVQRQFKRFKSTADLETTLKSLSAMTKNLIEVEQAAKIAGADLDDLRYTDVASVSSAPQMSPAIIKAMKSLTGAVGHVQKAHELVNEAKQCIRQAAPPEAPRLPDEVFAGKAAPTKTLNLFWADRELEKVIEELAEDKNRNAELTHAQAALNLARFLMKCYGDRLRQQS